MNIFKPPAMNTILGIPVVTTRLEYDSSIYVSNTIRTGWDALAAVENHIADFASECAFVIACDIEFHPVCIAKVGIGSQIDTQISVREAIRTALLSNASFITLVHNHPCGKLNPAENERCIKPSKEDIEITNQLSKVCSLMGIMFYDSIIVQRPFNGDYKIYSMRNKSIFGKKWIPLTRKDIEKAAYRSDKEEDIIWGPDPQSLKNNKNELKNSEKETADNNSNFELEQ